ncbi:MAG: FAD-dependent oxidoreductase, partial [Acidobacteriota bacterium]
LQRRLDPAELKRRHPGFAAAVDRGEIAGGLEIEGFTLGLHRFVRNLLDRLERQGASFLWRRQVLGLERGPDGAVSGLRTADGVQRSDHYVLSPGASCRDLLAGTASDAAIQGILGLWHFLPHVEPRLGRSVKIHREGHVGEDSNITVGRDPSGRPTLILGSGYGFLGERELDMASPEIQCLFDALEVTARRYLPDAYARAVKEGTLYGDRKACVRPFTSTGLGLFEVLPTAEGGRLVITGGHNTGGFTQAPAVAEAVAETLGGGTHAMQSLFRPDRGRTAADPAGQALASPPPEVESATALSAVGSG